ncbi:MAG: hypothetical protein HY677_03370 [Chloroflexi bacterium]|nr:hypothetical protein [Chloroflexota bacterium]
MRTKRTMAVLAVFVLFALLLVACGKEEKKASPTVAPPTAAAATSAATKAPAATAAATAPAAATAAPTTAAAAGEIKLRGMASAAGMTPSRKLSEEILAKYWYAKQEYDFNTKPRYGGIEQWVFNTKVNLSPLDPAAGCIPCTIYSSQLLNHGDNLMSDVMGGKRDDLLEMTPVPDLAKSWAWKDDRTFEM